jgi:hypothetical protein
LPEPELPEPVVEERSVKRISIEVEIPKHQDTGVNAFQLQVDPAIERPAPLKVESAADEPQLDRPRTPPRNGNVIEVFEISDDDDVKILGTSKKPVSTTPGKKNIDIWYISDSDCNDEADDEAPNPKKSRGGNRNSSAARALSKSPPWVKRSERPLPLWNAQAPPEHPIMVDDGFEDLVDVTPTAAEEPAENLNNGDPALTQQTRFTGSTDDCEDFVVDQLVEWFPDLDTKYAKDQFREGRLLYPYMTIVDYLAYTFMTKGYKKMDPNAGDKRKREESPDISSNTDTSPSPTSEDRPAKKPQDESVKQVEGEVEKEIMMECQCCFMDVAFDECTHCNSESTWHFFCKTCARSAAETQIGMQRYKVCHPPFFSSHAQFININISSAAFIPVTYHVMLGLTCPKSLGS